VAEIIARRVPQASTFLASQVADGVARMRSLALTKPPGVAEAINWAAAAALLGLSELTVEGAESTLGVVLKHADDHDVVHAYGLPALVGGDG
jgi:hypothetical protein